MADDNFSYILQDTFYFYPSMSPCVLLLTEKYLVVKSCIKTETIQEVDISNIIGCQSVYKKRDKLEADTCSYLRIYFYPLKVVNGLLNKKPRRERHSLKFAIKKFETYQENACIVSVWKRAILWLMQGKQLLFDGEVRIPASVPKSQSYLIALNPHSGPGKAIQIFKKQVVPVLLESDIHYELLITDHKNHARDYVKNMDLSKWTGIVIVSGDGLVFEVFNGLMARDDWEYAVKIPIGVIPGGSGNGLARAINHAIGEPYDTTFVTSSVLNIVRGRIAPMDLVQIETAMGSIYSFLSVGWGLLADIDIESERLRVIGEARFTVWAVIRLLNLRKYKGRLSYLPVAGYLPNTKVNSRAKRSKTFDSALSTKMQMNNYNSMEESICRSKSFGEEPSEIPTHNGDETVKLLQFKYSDTFSNSLVSSSTSDLSNNFTGSNEIFANEHEDNNHYAIASPCNDANGKPPPKVRENAAHRPMSTLPPLSKPVPGNWTVEEGEFVLVYVVYQSHISSDLLFAPEAKMDDGIMWLTVMRSGVSRSQVIEFLSLLLTGEHVNVPYVDVVPIHAFRLEPFQNDGVITVDGEVIPCSNIQGEVLPSISRVMSR